MPLGFQPAGGVDRQTPGFQGRAFAHHPVAFEGARRAWAGSLELAGATLDDLSFVETHDCFTIAELIEYEAMGLAKPGEGHRVVREGTALKTGRLPINPSGGLKSKGHPVG
ncbi:thiolase C-terminal domain-containing protein, partial [Agrobacterium tumefaciens]|uniref:thiolase C-terminal domain-containing protein n=1 Tax=Agrobacterium tumefaciens TaxID=358 RepID=UPI003C6BF143